MSSSSPAFGETLQFITQVKLHELEKRRDAYEAHAKSILSTAQKEEGDPIKQNEILLDGIKSWSGWSAEGDLNVTNIELWVEQAKYDPGFPPNLLKQWSKQMKGKIDHETTRFEYACLFGKLLNEWLQDKQQALTTVPSSDANDKGDFEKLNRKETLEQKAKLESLIFKSKEVDVPALETYLEELFSDDEAKKSLKRLRRSVEDFSKKLRTDEITTGDMKWCIKALLQSDLLSDAKQMTLREFSGNPTIVAELASVLNMQLASLSSWKWPSEGVFVEPRRHLNGKTRFFLDAEILTSLLLEYLGVRWCVQFKTLLRHFSNSAAWKDSQKALTKDELARRAAFIGTDDNYASINRSRRIKQNSDYFMTQLPSTVFQHSSYDDEDSSNWNEPGGSLSGPVELKQGLLHFLSTDTLLHKTLHGRAAVVRTDLEWFGPSLSLQTILTVLKFFGMPEIDLQFMRSFLECPVKFTDDPAGTPARTRQCGTPLSFSLSKLCGEIVLFVMDFGVNQKADGLFLYRIHDDFWFWDQDAARCAAAWAEMNKFTDLAGLKFNQEKTGSVLINQPEATHTLPSGDVRWGFLRMDAAAGGRFIIDQSMVDEHIVEFRRQLQSTTSVFSWVQAYNKYIAFLIRNFGAPAKVYGRMHVDDVISTLARVQEEMFPQSKGSFVETLADILRSRFDIHDIPHSWYYWPNAAGGLEVKHPLIELMAMRKDLPKDPYEILQEAFDTEKSSYRKYKEAYDSKPDYQKSASMNGYVIQSYEPFFSFEEFIKGREGHSPWWDLAFGDLMKQPQQLTVEETPQVQAALRVMDRGIQVFGTGSGASGWDALKPYWKWLISLYHDEMVKKFGSITIVDPTTIPVGMLGVFKSSKVRWEQ